MFCTHCGKEIKDDAKFCRYCGQSTGVGVSDTKELEPTCEDQSTKPRSLDQERRTESTVERQAVEPEHGEKTSKAGKLLIAVLVVLIVLVAGLGVAVLLSRNQNNAKTPDSGKLESIQRAEQEAGQDSDTEPNAETAVEPSPSPSPELLKTDYASLLQGLKSQAKLSLVTTDASAYPTIKLYVSLQDASGSGENIVLQSPTAGIMESVSGGAAIERTVRSVERLEGNVGIGMDIIVDESGSMQSDLSQMQGILQDFIQSLDYDAGDKGEIIGFNSEIFNLCSYTDNKENLLNGISNLYATSQTALYDALYRGITYASYRTGANCVIGFTDGEDNVSSVSYSEVIAFAQQRSIPLYLIGTGEANQEVLASMAQQTGGGYWNIDSIGSMDEVLQQIYQVQKDMYCITYETDAALDPTADRAVDCVLEEADGSLGGSAQTLAFQYVEKYETQQHISRYEIIQADISWTDAYQACIAKGGHLATITSQQEMDTLTAMAEHAGLSYLWLGGYTTDVNGQPSVIWTTGEAFDSYTQWYPGEPSIRDKDGTAEYYLMLWYVNNYWSWNDQRNDVVSDYAYFKGNMGYICEYDDYVGG